MTPPRSRWPKEVKRIFIKSHFPRLLCLWFWFNSCFLRKHSMSQWIFCGGIISCRGDRIPFKFCHPERSVARWQIFNLEEWNMRLISFQLHLLLLLLLIVFSAKQPEQHWKLRDLVVLSKRKNIRDIWNESPIAEICTPTEEFKSLLIHSAQRPTHNLWHLMGCLEIYRIRSHSPAKTNGRESSVDHDLILNWPLEVTFLWIWRPETGQSIL